MILNIKCKFSGFLGKLTKDHRQRSQINFYALKGVIQMNKKLLSILGGSALAAMMLVGCNANDQEPPPEEEAPTEEPAPEENGGMDEGNNGNQEGDMDMGEDENTPEEEPLEDNKDLQDKDNKDQ
jgi:hypothetical protein